MIETHDSCPPAKIFSCSLGANPFTLLAAFWTIKHDPGREVTVEVDEPVTLARGHKE